MTKSNKEKTFILISIVTIILLGGIIYANSLKGQFIWDDHILVNENQYIRNWSNLTLFFTNNIWWGAGSYSQYNYYRPLLMFSYAFDYFLWNLNVIGYHITNTLLHILASLSLFYLLNILYKDTFFSLLTSLFFISHPIHTEAISYISGRADPLSTIFILLCFIFYIKQANHRNTVLFMLMLLSYIIALLSKENCLILPALLFLYHYSFKKKLSIKKILSILTIGIIYVIIRMVLLKSLLPDITQCFSIAVIKRVPGLFVATVNYLKLLILPFNLHLLYGNKLFNFTDLKAIFGFITLIFLLIFAFKFRDSNRVISFSFFWFILTLMPISNLYPLSEYMAERWLYLPSIGFFLIIANILTKLYRTKRLKVYSVVLIIILLSFYSFLTIKQNKYWREPIVFNKRILQYVPTSIAAHNDLGVLYAEMGHYDEAIKYLEKTLQLDSNTEGAYHNLGILYNSIEKQDLAIESFKRAIEINPDFAEAHNNLGSIYSRRSEFVKAIEYFKKAVDINPGFAKAYNNLGMAYASLSNYDLAIEFLKKAITINPRYAGAHYNLSLAYYFTKQYALALKYCQKAKKLGFADAELLEELKSYNNEQNN